MFWNKDIIEWCLFEHDWVIHRFSYLHMYDDETNEILLFDKYNENVDERYKDFRVIWYFPFININ